MRAGQRGAQARCEQEHQHCRHNGPGGRAAQGHAAALWADDAADLGGGGRHVDQGSRLRSLIPGSAA